MQSTDVLCGAASINLSELCPGRSVFMESRRALGLLIAVIAAILILLAGRSCARSINETNEKNRKSSAPVGLLTENVTTAAPTAAPVQTPQPPQETVPPTEEDPTPGADEIIDDTPATTKSRLDEMWESEHPSYLDPYGFLDESGKQPPTSVHIEIN